jgi:hypothetical protein
MPVAVIIFMNKSLESLDVIPCMAYPLTMKMNKTIRFLIKAFLKNRTYSSWLALQLALTGAIPQSTIHNHE